MSPAAKVEYRLVFIPALAIALAAAAFLTVIWLGTTPAGAQDGYQPDEQLIDDVRGYARETEKGHDHVLRWMRVLHTLDALDDMTAAEAQDYADNGWERWNPVADALADLENAPGDYQPDGQLISDVRGYARETDEGYDHVLRWIRVLHTFDVLEHMTAAEAQRYADNGWQRWEPVADELAQLEASTAEPEPTPTATPEPTPTPTPDPNRPPVVNTQAKHYADFIGRNNAPRGLLVSKPFHGIFSDPDGDKLTYSVSVPADQLRLVDEVLIPTEEQMEQSGHPIEVIQRVFFRGEAEADWKALSPPVPDRPVVTATLTATDPGGRAASVQGDFLVWWESYPEVVSAVASASVMELTFDWAVEDDPAPKAGQFTVHVVNGDGSSRTVAVSSVSVSGKVMRLGLASALAAGQTVTLDYAYDYPDDVPLQRAGGGDAAPGFTGQLVEVSLDPPGEPQNFALDAEPGRKALLATWDPATDANSYKLRWRETGGEFEADNAVTVSGAIWAITVSDYGRWEMRLQACNAAGCGPEASRTADVVQAASLRLQRAVDADGKVRPRTITATWDPVEDAASYTLRWRRIGANTPAQGQPDGAARQNRAADSPFGAGGQGANAQGENRLNLPADRTGANFNVPDGGAYRVNLQARNDGNELIAQTDTNVNQAPNQPDTTPPWLVRGEIDGNRATLYFSEPLDEDAVGGEFNGAVQYDERFSLIFNSTSNMEISGNKVMVHLGDLRVKEGLRAFGRYITNPADPAANSLRDLAGNLVRTPHRQWSGVIPPGWTSEWRGTRNLYLDNLTGRPYVSGAEISSDAGADLSYVDGETVRVELAFSEAVDVTGTPRLKIDLDPSDGGERWADYAGGSGTKTLEFAYTVVAGDLSTTGVAVLENTLQLNGGAIRSASAVGVENARLAHQGLRHNYAHKVVTPATAAPILLHASVSGAALTLTFSETLGAAASLSNSAFTVRKTPQGGSEQTVSLSGSPAISGATVALTLASAVLDTDTGVKVSYAKPTSGTNNKLVDAGGAEVESFTDEWVANASDTTQPRLVRGEIDGDVDDPLLQRAAGRELGGRGRLLHADLTLLQGRRRQPTRTRPML